MRIRHHLAVTGVVIAAVVGSFSIAAPAYADDYPSWSDVEKARSDESSKKAQITQIEKLISGLQS
ncbi:MAG: cell wall-binding protein, partial [Mycetocola sp.]